MNEVVAGARQIAAISTILFSKHTRDPVAPIQRKRERSNTPCDHQKKKKKVLGCQIMTFCWGNLFCTMGQAGQPLVKGRGDRRLMRASSSARSLPLLVCPLLWFYCPRLFLEREGLWRWREWGCKLGLEVIVDWLTLQTWGTT